MTFIASVVAKKGVAIIADSLVTSQMPILNYNDFYNYLNHQAKKNEKGEILLNPEEVSRLFNQQPVFTKDFEEKLIKLNQFTALTTTGAAYINDTSISDLIEQFKELVPEVNDLYTTLERIIELLTTFINGHVVAHINKYHRMNYFVCILTHYQKTTHKTLIYRLVVSDVDRKFLEDHHHDYVTLSQELDWVKVVCDGQNKISDNILYGLGKQLYYMIPDIMTNIFRIAGIHDKEINDDLVNKVIDDPYFKDMFAMDAELLNLTDLSIQQAVDLASLLMRLEVDFQRYTKNIPTVGGQIKLAIIDENGFQFIAGNKIIAPKHLGL
jgi:hypothetical protein